MPQELSRRELIALWVIIIAGAGIVLVAIAVLWIGSYATTDQNRFLVLTVFNALVPIFGTWVGTVIAFYFSRENFAAAAQSTQALIQQFGDERLRQIPVDRAWIPAGNITKISLGQGQTDDNVEVRQIRALLSDTVTRVPIFEATGAARYVIHQSMIFKFIADHGGDTTITPAGGAPRQATLTDFVADAQLRAMVTKLAFCPRTGTLADAKGRMEAIDGCQDVFITATGQSTEPVLGWITNVDITKHSRA